ncbi:hypothetical protein HanRHA438_Chr05g0206161 [Helianthus annuus]|nr:hypothetical protein HanRHA438_Chr05g0206161 [Helianthus annuus]
MWKWTQERKVNGSSGGEEASMNTNARDLCRYIIEDSLGNGYANDMLKIKERAEWKVYMVSAIVGRDDP